jgi:hypothetical protein
MKTEELEKQVEDLQKQLESSLALNQNQAKELKLKDLKIESKSENSVFDFKGEKMQFQCKIINHNGQILETEEIVKNIDNYSELIEKIKKSRILKPL